MARTQSPEVRADILRLSTQVRAMLVRGEELPSERELAEQLHVRRHRLRLALAQMRAEGELPQPVIKRSLSVLRGDMMVQDTNALEVIELRLLLEPAMVRLAAVRASPVQIVKITQAATTPKGVTRTTGDLAFHKLVADAAGNPLAASLYGFLRSIGADQRLYIPCADQDVRARILLRDQEHQRIAHAIAARAPDAAEQAMRQHLRRVQQEIADRLTAPAPPHPDAALLHADSPALAPPLIAPA